MAYGEGAAVIGFPRWTTLASFSGGSWSGTYPLSNLGIEPLSKIARSTDATLANAQFVATLSSTKAIRALALARHNLSINAKIRIRLYRDAALTDIAYDSGWVDVWPVVYPYSALDWEDDNWWSGKYSAAEIAGYIWTRPFWLGNVYLARAVKVEIDDTGNSDGYVEAGLFEIAQGYQLPINPDLGAQYGYRFRTVTQESLGGTKYHERRDKPRVFRGSVSFIDRDHALAKLFEQLRQHDLDTPFLWFPHPDEPMHWLRNVFIAKNVDPGLFSYAAFGTDAVPLAFEEVL